MRFERVSSSEQVEQVAKLAREIWYEYYVPLIGRAQVDYMVERFQTAAAMSRQIADGYEYFLIQSELGESIGYLAVRQDPDSLFLSKLYLRADARGGGRGGQSLRFVEDLARERGLSRLWLTVNKGNPSVYVYERKGFTRAEAIVIDIGGGFVMDDYRMEKFLA